MTKARLTALVSALLFLRWLAVSHVTVTACGLTATVPALAIAIAAAVAVAGAVATLLVYRDRAERAMLAQRAMHTAWQTHKAAAR
jgi:hypothetical protein